MSALPARNLAGRSSPQRWRARLRPRLRIVRTPATSRSRLPFLLVCLTILGGALLGALALNTAIATTAYEVRERQWELAELTQLEQRLTTQINTLESPASLAAAADRLGMVQVEGLSIIDLATGTISGPAADLIPTEEGD